MNNSGSDTVVGHFRQRRNRSSLLKHEPVDSRNQNIATVAVLTSLLLHSVSGANAASIGVNVSQNTKVRSTESPGIVAGDHWNNVSTAAGTTLNLRDDADAVTTADVTVVSGSGYGAFGAGSTGNSGFNRMVDDGLAGSGRDDANREVSVSFAQIPYATYDVYVFTQSRTTNANELSVTLGDTTYFYATDGRAAADEIKLITSTTSGAPTKGGSYAVFRNLSKPSFVVKTGGSISGRISNQIFGIHIVDAKPSAPSPTPVLSQVEFFSQFCMKCHSGQKHKGDVRLDQIGSRVAGDNHELWETIVQNIQRGDMPPEDEQQPRKQQRQAFLKQTLSMLKRYEADNQPAKDPLLRLTNQQIAHSLRDLLGTATDIADRLIRDPIDKHGYSTQLDLDLSGSHLLLYAKELEKVLEEVFPDKLGPPENVFRVVGNDWEKCHWAGDNFLNRRLRILYEGPEWIGDKFRIPIPPKHEFRMFLRDNRSEGRFRIGLTVRNEPPSNGGPRVPQELGIYLCQGGYLPYKLVKAIQVAAKEGVQHFEMIGSLADHLGVNTSPIIKNDPFFKQSYMKFRTLTITNHNELMGHKLPARFGQTEPIFLVRPDEQWIEAFGQKPGLRPSNNGNAGNHGNEGRGPAIYPQAMKTHGHTIIERVEFEVPYHASWPPPVAKPFLQNGLLYRPSLTAGLQQFVARAWRRPLGEKEVAYIDRLVEKEYAADRKGVEALRNTVKTILLDSRFLFLNELDSHVLASRLAYFLWNGPPDAELIASIGGTPAIDDDVLGREVDRLLADARSQRFVSDFVGRWVDFTAFDAVAIDPNFYPRFKNPRLGVSTKEDMKQESVAFFSEVLRKDLSCLTFLDSEFVMLNDLMAEHYGAPAVHTARFVRAPALKTRGGGVLAQGTFLLGHSTGQDAHAIKRAVWLRSRLLGDPPAEPPPEVPGIDEQQTADKKQGRPLSIKEKFDKHLATGTTCYDCHKDIDHWGIAMEGFDAVGLPRTRIAGAGPVEKHVEIDGHRIDGLLAMKQYLLAKHREEFARAFTEHMLSYAIGRPLTYMDEQQVSKLQKGFAESGYQMKSLIKAIVTSPTFRLTRSSEPIRRHRNQTEVAK